MFIISILCSFFIIIFQVKPEDGFTTMICKQCQHTVISHLQTYDKVQHSQKSIRKYSSMNLIQPKSTSSSKNEEHGAGFNQREQLVAPAEDSIKFEVQKLLRSSVQPTTLDYGTTNSKATVKDKNKGRGSGSISTKERVALDNQLDEDILNLVKQNRLRSSVQSTTLDSRTMINKLRTILEDDTVPTKKSKPSEFKHETKELKFQKLEHVLFFHRFQREMVEGVILATLPRKRYSVLSLGDERKIITFHESSLKKHSI